VLKPLCEILFETTYNQTNIRLKYYYIFICFFNPSISKKNPMIIQIFHKIIFTFIKSTQSDEIQSLPIENIFKNLY
jgi:hypothetical protein